MLLLLLLLLCCAVLFLGAPAHQDSNIPKSTDNE
jgi:hypothetical protein